MLLEQRVKEGQIPSVDEAPGVHSVNIFFSLKGDLWIPEPGPGQEEEFREKQMQGDQKKKFLVMLFSVGDK